MLPVAECDLKIFGYFNSLAKKNPWLDRLVIFFARYYTLLLPPGVAVYLWLFRPNLNLRAIAISQALALLASRGLVTELIRLFFRRKRPFLAHRVVQLIKKYSEASFPSGHTISLMSAGFALMVFAPGVGWFVAVSGLAVGIARVISGVHYPLDVLAGVALSWPAAWLGLIFYQYFLQ